MYPHRFMLLRCVCIFSYANQRAGTSRAAFVHVQAKEIVSLSPTKLETVSFRLYLHYTG